MESITFFFKSLVVAFIAVLLMQAEVGGATVEEHILVFLRGSSVAQPIHEVAEGATKVIRTSWNQVTRWINNNRPLVGERAASLLNLERSEGYKRSQEKKAAETESITD